MESPSHNNAARAALEDAMAKRMTFEEKQAASEAAALARKQSEAMEFAAVVQKTRMQEAGMVVKTAYEVIERFESILGRPQAHVLYSLLNDFEEARREYKNELAYISNKIVDAQRDLERNEFYSDTPVRRADDMVVAYAKLYAT